MFVSRALSFRLPLIAACIMSAFAMALTILLYAHLSVLAVQQQAVIGETLAAQLAQSAKSAMVHADTVSLQVVVENLVAQTPSVERASVFDLNHDLLAQSQRSITQGRAPVAFTSSVSVEDSISGYVRIELQSVGLFSRAYFALWIALALWLGAGVILSAWLFKQGHRIDSRVRSLYRRLPASDNSDDGDNGDELVNLERRIAPLLVNVGDSDGGTPHFACTLALHCSNLPRLKAQLSRDNFEQLLSGLDRTLDRACRLYDGKRLSSFQQSVFIRFAAASADGDQALHALLCACATLEIIRSQARDQGVAIELSAALSAAPETRSSSTLIADLERQEHLQQLAALLPLAGPWQILVAKPLDTHAGLIDCATFETLANAQDTARFAGFAPNQRALLDRQLVYLQAHEQQGE